MKHGDPLRQCRGFNAKGFFLLYLKTTLVFPFLNICFTYFIPRTASPLFFYRSGETSQRNGPVWSGGQQHFPGVSASLASGLRQVALPEGREEESGEELRSNTGHGLELPQCRPP